MVKNGEYKRHPNDIGYIVPHLQWLMALVDAMVSRAMPVINRWVQKGNLKTCRSMAEDPNSRRLTVRQLRALVITLLRLRDSDRNYHNLGVINRLRAS